MTVGLRWCLAALVIAVGVTSTLAQDIQRLDPTLDQLVPAKAVLERIATGFNRWTEGPVWTREGSLLFAEIPANNIILWAPGQSARVFIHPSGYNESAPFGGSGSVVGALCEVGG